MRSIFPHTCTAWVKGTEGRQASWGRKLLPPCRFAPTYGATAGERGDTSERSADLLVKGRVKPLGRGDKVALGDVADAAPPADALTVSTVSMVSIGARVDHWECELR